MSAEKTKPDARSIETEFEIDAPVEAVWKALTDAEELIRWFPLQARVTPGVGGSAWASWGAPWEGEATIEIWEPNRHFRLVSPPFGSEASQDPSVPAAPIATDYILEARGGKTVLRLVHSGFQLRSNWDEEFFEATRVGWQFELRGLRHYLQNHRGTPRSVVWARANYEVSHEEAWRRLMGAEGLLAEGSLSPAGAGGLKEWDRYSIRAATGDALSGFVHLYEPPRHFCATVEPLNNAFLRVRLDELFGKREANLWLSLYGLPQAQVDGLRERWTAMLGQLLPQP